MSYWIIGKFQVPLNSATSVASANVLAPFDVNGDGLQDLVIVYNNIQTNAAIPVSVLLNNGSGNFTDATATVFSGQTVPVTQNVNNYTLADFNGDGRLDLFVGDAGYDANPYPGLQNVLLLSSGATGLTNAAAKLPQVVDYTHTTATGDLNGDGKADIYVGNESGGTPATGALTAPYLLINDGAGGFTRSDLLPASVLARTSAKYSGSTIFDANGDGKADLFLGGIDNVASIILLNPGNGDFTNAASITIPKPVMTNPALSLGAQAADLNGDGKLDLVVSYDDSPIISHYLQVLINNGNGGFTDATATAIPTGLNGVNSGVDHQPASNIQLTDINGDGFADILLQNGTDRPLLLNDGTGRFVQLPASFFGGYSIYPYNGLQNYFAMDANADGRRDILIYDQRRNLPENANLFAILTQTDPGTSQIGTSSDDGLLGDASDEALSGLAGDDVIFGAAGSDTLNGGTGNDVLDGGGHVDTAVFAGAKSAYTITQTETGRFTIAGPDGTDTLNKVEYAKFDDQTVRLLPGSGTAVDFAAAQPAVYMGGIRDFDGNNLTGQGTQVIDPATGNLVAGAAWDGVSGWSVAGSADVSGSGATAQILFNNLIGRWAEVTTESDGKVYFDNYNWGGDSRIVGIYTDPEVALGHAVQGGPDDSQRRFQNDLFIGNIKSVVAAGDYNHDGFQEVYFSLTDGTAYLHALMWNDGNIQYANYQNAQQVQDYLTANGVASSVWSSWLHEEPIQVFTAPGAMAPPLLAQTGATLAGVAV